jgi:hypothetical protein
MIFIGTLFCNLLEDAMRLHLQPKGQIQFPAHERECSVMMGESVMRRECDEKV